MIKKCVVCGRIFTASANWRKRCDECIAKGIQPKKSKTAYCRICGKLIRNAPQIYKTVEICPTCVEIVGSETNGYRKCVVCGKQFIPNSVQMGNGQIRVSGMFTCSIQCTDKFYGFDKESGEEKE